MKTSLVAISMFLGTLSLTAFAVTIIGTPSCGEWVNHREAYKKTEQAADIPNQGILDLQRTSSAHSLATLYNSGDERWLMGYVSGLAVESGKDFLKQTDNVSIFLWIDNYCTQNPLTNLSDAGLDLMSTLSKQSKMR